MKRKWLGIAIAICVTLSLIAIPLSGCAAPAPTTPVPTTPAPTTPTPTTPAPTTPTPVGPSYEWIMSVFMPEGYLLYDGAADFISRLEEASEGRISVRLYGGSLLGDYMTQMKNVTAGTQDCAISSASTANSPKWDVNVSPFMCCDWDSQLESYGQPDGWLFKAYTIISEEDCNWKLIGIPVQGFTGIISNIKFDSMPGPKDVKIRVMASETARLAMEACGFSPVTIAWSEIPSALMLGTVDAAWGPTSADDFLMFADVYKYAYRFNFNSGANINIMNLDLFNSLSPADQQMIVTVGAEWQEWFNSIYVAHDNEVWEEVAKLVEVIELTPAEWNANAAVVRPVVWPYLEEVLGSELMIEVKAHASHM